MATVRIYASFGDSLAIFRGAPGRMELARVNIGGATPTALAVDPKKTSRLYSGTMDHGLWLSEDAGMTWRGAGAGIKAPRVMSVAASPAQSGLVFAGTELTGLYRSEDAGRSFSELSALLSLPSRPRWGFPERPKTHHVGWIHPHPEDARRLLAIIHQGGLMRSEDGGETWRDHPDGAPRDPHALVRGPKDPERFFVACGGEDAKFRPGI